jgi:hypothetical protein
MQTFKNFLEERFINLLPQHEKEKHEHAKHVHDMLTKSYADQGGIHGSGFENPESMVKKIPMWKLHKSDGKVRAAALYKDKSGRKRVAIATDGSDEGKKAAARIMVDDITRGRSYGETSGRSLSFLKKNTGEHLKKHVRTFEEASSIAKKSGDEVRKPPDDDPEVKRHPEYKDHFYQRKIGDEWHTKLMVGTTGKTIT